MNEAETINKPKTMYGAETISNLETNNQHTSILRAQNNFTRLITHVVNLYCMGDSSSISSYEAAELTASVSYVLGITDATMKEAVCNLDVDDPIALWHSKLATLDTRVDSALDLWCDIIATMPPIRNIALRDTLASLGELRKRYDTRFAAHIVPCDIDYQLSEPVDPNLGGIDYIEAWLAQLQKETRWLAQFNTESCIKVLERICPDYKGLHVNLYDLLRPYQDDILT